MKVRFVKGVPQALFPSFVSALAQKNEENNYFVTRWNSDIERYLASFEFVEEYSFAGVLSTLNSGGFSRVQKVSEIGDFSLTGDVITFWQPGFGDPVRLSYFGDEMEEISTIDATTGRSLRKLKNLLLGNINELTDKVDYDNIRVETKYERFSETAYVNIGRLVEVKRAFPGGQNQMYSGTTEMDLQSPPLFFKNTELITNYVTEFTGKGYLVTLITKHNKALPRTLSSLKNVHINKSELNLAGNHDDNYAFVGQILKNGGRDLEMGFVSHELNLIVLTDRELFGTVFIGSRRNKSLKSSQAQKLLKKLEGEIELEDLIVHEDYGVGIYKGFVMEDEREYLKIAYALEDELFVPLEQLHKLTKYIGDEKPELTRLGKSTWERVKSSVKKQVAIAARELARHYANVELANAVEISSEDSNSYLEFCNEFEFELTEDQIKSEREILNDLAKGKPMSRLLIGDVGYGKTEMIMRAGFKVAEVGLQVIILCPTTVLAIQHYKNFVKRFKKFPLEVGLLSRNNTQIKNREILENFEQGKVDIIIATHRALANDLKPKRLGLLVIDEEQRFGVKQKEKIRKLEAGVHTLFVSATPIPRTLAMAMSSIQDISMITTPPPGRRAVETHVQKLNWHTIVKAVSAEVERGGQVFFIHNEIKTIPSVVAKLQGLIPDLRITVAHGSMPPENVDKVVTDFYERKYDCLVATTIIENGIDFPNVNTLIVNNAHRLGLAQMYQLRGRVGRSSRQAAAYFFYQGRNLPAENEIEVVKTESDLKPAKYIERLEAILEAQELGSGFRIASRDLEIRGAGNLLGAEQHGSIAKVGYGLYMQMLADEIEKLKT